MSPVFRHGGLRLYLLKLLDEAPRHGYDVIRLLQDRFLGVYSPSPGTIYPRLARLEEEGLVTHEVIDGKKVYRITDAGREELNRRPDDLADLEDELAASVRDIAREISRDVRETVRSMRDELTWAVREAARGRDAARGREDSRREDSRREASEDARREASEQAHGASAGEGTTERPGEPWSGATAGSGGPGPGGPGPGNAGPGEPEAPGDETAAPRTGRSRASDDWREWADWLDWRDWRDWADWARRHDWADWAERTGGADWKERARASKREWKEQARAGGQQGKDEAGSGRQQRNERREETNAGAGDADRGKPDDRREDEADLIGDLQRLAAAFARELRGVAWHAEMLSEDAVGNLGAILTDTLNRIRNEVFRAPASARTHAGPADAGPADAGPFNAGPTSAEPSDADTPPAGGAAGAASPENTPPGPGSPGD